MRFLLLLAFFAFSACATTTNGDTPMDDSAMNDDPRGGEMDAKQVAMYEPFTIELGETALIPADDVVPDETARIRFDGVETDSRCPANVDCVRAGEATGQFTLIKDDGTEMPFTLEIPGMLTEMQDVDTYTFDYVDGYSVVLLLLQPYPGLDAEEGMPTTATLEVRRTRR
jgi:hypothetical protein